jgi:hypothetical protein
MTLTQRITLGILTAGLLLTYGPIAYAGEFNSDTPWGMVFLLLAFLFVPYLVLAIAVQYLGRNRDAIVLLTVGAVLVVLGGVGTLYYAMFVSDDPYSFLLVLFVPIFQIIVAIVTAGPAAFLAIRARGKETEAVG